MQINLSKNFVQSFDSIFEYIAKDNFYIAKNFKDGLLKQIKNIPNFPYKYRKSIYFNDENIRDMIFKKYTT